MEEEKEEPAITGWFLNKTFFLSYCAKYKKIIRII